MHAKQISLDFDDGDTDVARLVEAFLSIRNPDVKNAILNIIEHVAEKDATEFCAIYAQYSMN